MRLKTKLVVAITVWVFVVVVVLSCVYFRQVLQLHIDQSYKSTDIIAHQVQSATRQAIENGTRNLVINANDPVQLRAAIAKALRSDPALKALLSSVIIYSPAVYDVAIADGSGLAYLSTDQSQEDKPVQVRPEYSSLQRATIPQIWSVVFGPPILYNVSVSLERPAQGQTVATVHVGVRTTFVSENFRPWLEETAELLVVMILATLITSVFVANLAFQPIEDISLRLDALTQMQLPEAEPAGGELETGDSRDSSDTVVQVSHKIERLGRRMRNVEEVFSAMKENLDQILSNLQDGMMLFTHDARAVLVSNSVERFLGVERDRILGAKVPDIFDRTTVLGRIVREAFDRGISLVQEEITTETDRRVEVSLDFIYDDRAPQQRQGLGALLTLHDIESVQEIESELELSRRMAAIGRLTSGVGHEVKNPINAIVVHLELLRNKMNAQDSPAFRHLDVIQNEIQRLDRVVQTLVDFSRPVELKLHDQDLRRIVNAVLMLASVELETRGVRVVNESPARPVIVKVDADLMQQALLNVVLNGAQAMADGGTLRVRLTEDPRWVFLSVSDEGEGIPDDIRSKIFNLYFTTKKEGSGIGLAMTYRIIQLHNGQVDVESHVGQGTTFTLKIPVAFPSEVKLRGHLEADAATGTPISKEPWG
ncbi:PAS domain S-box protein [Alloacidobacterium dinghuense]|uniref:histidine kinase n=1 Tax=Alloacidobacterium dinghuense TaxID=2763107 RepID=A0A7G8BND4_9BACT|nr:ATP-binding protein [Alloacidobacterium dinghuense]QNI34054.1 PAS domain S-box protein [Alloacidobacterium dinghuense]